LAGGQPCIAGRRIRVQDIYVWHEHWGLTADEIAHQYDLTLAQVYAVLTYAFEDLNEIQTALRAADNVADEIARSYPSRFNR
jgi:uncharacterized protein (DUF433 family)